MAFISLKNRLSELPLVLAGPLLRRTESDNVTVWLALKESRTVKLEVFGLDSAGVVLLSGARKTVSIGANLHIVAVTATGAGSSVLIPDKTFTYNLRFTDNSGNTQNLEDAGVINSEARQDEIYAYASGLPSFSLPPSDLNDLRIFHLSCRKPHGGKVDAFVAIDNILNRVFAEGSASGTSNEFLAKNRPHQLFHTGDQIYADDVDDSLLFMLSDASKALLGWNEKLPTGIGDTPTGYIGTESIDDVLLPNMVPGNREEIIIDNGFTFGPSHLMRLGEYICMYLFVWSDVLWPKEKADFPALNDVYPLANNSATSSLYQNLVVQQYYLDHFRLSLKKVRKVLANIPSYMMCDDHEVTDDWFLNLKFTRRVLGDKTHYPPFQKNQLTSRIIQNGLTAFALCQGWGNKPGNFAIAGNEADLLTNINQLADENGSILNTWETIGTKVLPTLVLDGGHHEKLVGGLDYFFQMDFPKYKVIVLDTRNRRRFHQKLLRNKSAADLMSMSALDEQIPPLTQELPASVEFTLIVSPSPVLGHRFVEAGLQEALFEYIHYGYVAASVKVPVLPFLFSEPDLDIALDKEGWAFGKTIYQDLLHRLATYRKVIVLSGDVHYSFSGQIEYWNERNALPIDFPPVTSKILQLTASPSKNSILIPSRAIARISNYSSTPILEDLPIINNLPTLEFIGWQNSGYHIKKQVPFFDNLSWMSGFVKGYPNVHRFDKDTEQIPELSQAQVQWRYRMSYAQDSRPAATRGTVISTGEAISDTILKASEQHLHRGDKDIYRMAVGDDTFGELTFYDIIFNGVNSKGVTHSFWYNTAKHPWEHLNDFFPYTIHGLTLDLPPDSGSTVPGYEE